MQNHSFRNNRALWFTLSGTLFILLTYLDPWWDISKVSMGNWVYWKMWWALLNPRHLESPEFPLAWMLGVLTFWTTLLLVVSLIVGWILHAIMIVALAFATRRSDGKTSRHTGSFGQ